MKKLLIFAAMFLLPALLCFGLGASFAADEDAFASRAEVARGTVVRINHQVRFNGRDSEDVTTVTVSYKPRSGRALTADADVAYATGLSPGKPVDVLYAPAEPGKIQLRAGFLNRSSKVVFFTIFGGFWLFLALLVAAFAIYIRRIVAGATRTRGEGA